MMLSVIVPTYNAASTLPYLIESLSNQTCRDFEVIIIDDHSEDNTNEILKSCSHSIITLPDNKGPAYCRNIGAQKANGDIYVFTDSDCRLEADWLEHIQDHFRLTNVDVIMGKLAIMPSTFLGDAISCLGFPAGGRIGFDKIWKVDKDGFTHSLSSCNCAIRKDVFWETEGFDESFPYAGGEDSLLAYQLGRLNYRIKYCPDVIVHHPARDSLHDFIRWQFKRGVSSFIFSQKISDKMSYMSLRLWSTQNIIKTYYKDKNFILIVLLLCLSISVQFFGFFYAKVRKKKFS